MNTKRQTIWLVSMLSLMVVLSAYYLFTEDVNKLNLTNNALQQDNTQVANETVNPDGKTADKAVNGVSQDSAAKNDKNAANTKSADTKAADKAAADKAASADAQVLNKLQTQGKSGEDFFAAQQLKRDEDLQTQIQKLVDITSDPKKSPDEITKANNTLNELETKKAKVENIEDELGKDFKNVIVQEENGKFKVVVQAEKLEKSQAVSIFDLVINELNVPQDKIDVVVQH